MFGNCKKQSLFAMLYQIWKCENQIETTSNIPE